MSPVAPPQTGVPFAADLARFGDRPALITADRAVTYAELADLISAEALRLGGDRRLVMVVGGNDLDTVVCYLAALAAGHPVLMSPDRDPALESLIATYDPDVLVRDGRAVHRRVGTAHDLHPSLALLLSTSGTTGSPRLVRLSVENLQANAESIAEYLAIRPTDVAATTLPLHYCYGLSVLHSHLVRGASVLLTGLSVVDPCFWDQARRHGVTTLAGVPYTFELLDRIRFDPASLPTLRYLTQAGGRMEPERVRRYAELGRRSGFDLFVMYGATEATARMAYLPPDLAVAHPRAIGRPIPGGTLQLERAGDADVGELVYTGPNVMLGYAQSPADLALGREVTELRTGDLARRNEEGLFEVVGRRNRVAKVFGLRLDLDELDRLLTDEGHRAACAADDHRLVVAVQPRGRAGARLLLARVTRTLAERTGLPPSALSVHAVTELPRLANGKPDYSAVAALGSGGGGHSAALAPDGGGHAAPLAPGGADSAMTPDDTAREGTQAPARVAGLYAELLGRRRVEPGDSFVSLGGDSLSYVETSVRLEQLIGHLPADWHRRSVAELESARTGATARLRTVETNVVLRALAILAIVGTHGNLFTFTGGAHLLLALAGFNLGRFQLTQASRAERARRLLRSVARVAVPSLLWIGTVTLLTAAYPWQTALLVNGLFGADGWSEPAWHYWFVEALVATLLGVAALLALPVVDRMERRWPFWFPATLSMLALVTRYDLVELRGGDVIHRAHIVFWLFALGWATAKATSTKHRLVVSGLAVLTVPGFFGDAAREATVLVGLLALVWLPRVKVPAPTAKACAVLASASLYVYLSHWQVYPHLENDYPLAAVAASLAVGVALWQVADRVPRALAARLWALRRRLVGVPRLGPQRRAAAGGEVSARSPESSTGRAPGTTLTATGVPTG